MRVDPSKEFNRVLVKTGGNSSKVVGLAKGALDHVALEVDLLLKATSTMGSLFSEESPVLPRISRFER